MRTFLRQKFPFVLGLIAGLGFMLGMTPAAQAQIVLNDNNTSITRGTVYNNLPFLTATGGAAPYNFYYVSGPIPSGIVINPDGTLSGKTCGSNGKQTFNAKAIDSALVDSGSQAVAIIVNANNTNCGVTITPATVPRGQINRAYTTTTLASTGGTGPYSYTVVSGALPPGITLSPGGVLSGTPSSAGTYSATINSQGASGAGVITYTFTIDPAITLSPSTLPNGSTGTAYSQTLSASGTTSPYTFSLVSGTLPTGLSLSGAGVISGTPSALGTFNFTIRATDPNNSIGDQAYTVVITGPPLTVSPATLANGKELLSYSQTITAGGGTAPYTFTVSAGTLPPGLNLAAGGALTGTPTAGSAGTYNFTVTANDSASSTGSRPYTVTIAVAPTLTISPATLPNGKVGLAYSQTVSASGGTAPYTFSVSAGSLPPGLALSSGGILNGTPTAAGTYNFTVLATDTEGYTASLAYSVVVNPAPTITLAPAAVPNGKELLAYSQAITASGGTAPYTYTVTSGTLPIGVTLSGAGALSGTPASGSAGAYPFTVTATDNEGYTGAQAYTLTINPAPTITLAPLSLTSGQVGLPFSQTVTASNGTAPYTYSVTAGALPAGMSLSGAGSLSGTPAAAGTFNFTISATDNEGFIGSLAYSWTINPAPTITVNPATLPNGRENAGLSVVFYNQTITASGGTAPYVYTLTNGTLPAGLSLSSAGVLSGYAAPGSDGNYSFEVTATDDDGYTGTRTYALTIDPAPTITVNPATLANGKVGLAFSQTITAAGGTAPYTYSETGGSLPPGVTLSTGGLLSGTPTAAGTYTFTIAAADADSYFGTQNYSWVINPAPTIAVSPSTLPTGKENLVYAPQTLTAAGGTAPYTFSITSGSLPVGLTLSTGGVVSGTPTEDGSFNFTVEATDDEGFTGTQSISLSITAQPAISIAPTGLSNGKVGLAYTVTLTATGGTAPHVFSVSTGTLPPGLSLSGAGVLSGTPTNAGSWGFNVTATDADGYTAVRNYDLTINSAPTITVSPTSLAAANQNLAYSATITAAGGTAPYSYAVTSGSLPAGLSLSTGGGLSGTPTNPGNFNFDVTATDDEGFTGSRSYTLSVSAAPSITLSPLTLSNGQVGLSYSETVTASGGTAPYAFSVSAGTLPAGISLSGAGALSGLPTTAGSFNFTVTATDDLGYTGSQAYSLVIDPAPTLVISPAGLPDAKQSLLYSETLSTSGGTAPYTYALSSGALPAGLSLSGAGVLAGTPTVFGSFSFDVESTDSNGYTGALSYVLTVTAAPTLSLTPATLTDGNENLPYAETIVASGGTAPYTFAITAGSLPAGLSFASNGALSGTPTSAGVSSFTITVTDNAGYDYSQAYSLTIVAAPTITLAPASLPTANESLAYSTTISASGGSAPYSFAVQSGALPAGMSLAAGGVLSGAPSENGTFNFTASATDTLGYVGTRAYSLVVTAAPSISISPASLSDGQQGLAVSEAISASGGTAPYTFTVSAGSLPPGVTLSSGGALSGTPTSDGTYSFTITGTDDLGYTGNRAYSWAIYPASVISVAPASLPNGQVGLAYSETVSASGGTAPYTFSVSSGSLPSGLTLSNGGGLAGTPTSAGTYNFTVTAEDANTFTGLRAYTVVIDPAPTLSVSPATLPAANQNLAYSETLSTSGGTAPYTYAVSSGSLPSGLSLSVAGVLSGTPSVFGSFSFTIESTDTNGYTGTQAYTFVVTAEPTLALSPTTLTDGLQNLPYAETIVASGGTAPYTFAITAGSLPAGLAFASNGALSGTPTAAGSSSFTVTVTDGLGYTYSAGYSLTVVPEPTFSFSPLSLPVAFETQEYLTTITVSGGTIPHTFAIQSGSLPAGVVLTGAGSITGTPSENGVFNFVVIATDDVGYTGTRAYTLTVTAAPTITLSPSALSNGTVGLVFNETLTASGGSTPYTFAISSGALPPGLTLSTGGTLSGTPGTAGNFNFDVTATDNLGYTGTASYSLTIAASPTLSVNPATLSSATQGVVYSASITASGGTAPYTFVVTAGTLPSGLSLSATGDLSGTPTAAGSFNFTVTATDDNAFTGTRAYTFTVDAAPTITITPASLMNGLEGTPYALSLGALGGTAPYSFVISSGSLPSGMTLSGAGVLGGTPSVNGTFNFTVTATDASTFAGSRAYTLVVDPAPVFVFSPASLVDGEEGVPYSVTISASGGFAPLTYNLVGGAVPPGMGFDTSGLLGGTPAAAGTFNFVVEVVDDYGYSATQAYSLVIAPAAPTVITVAPSSLPIAKENLPYSETLMASGGTGPYIFTVSAGALPTGLLLSSGGVLSGTPTTNGTYSFTIEASDSNGNTGSTSYSFTVSAAPSLSIVPPSLPSGKVTLAYNVPLMTMGGTAPYTYSLTSGALPSGISLSTSGEIQGTTLVDGSFNFDVTSEDADGYSVTQSYSLLIEPAPTLTVSPTTLPNAEVGVPYSQALTAAGGTAPYIFSLSSGALPPGLTLSTDGTLSGTVTAVGAYNFTLTVVDGEGFALTVAFSLEAQPPAPVTITITPAALGNGQAGLYYEQLLQASGGTGPYSFNVTGGTLPNGLTLATDGTLAGTPLAAGSSSFTVEATDSLAQTGAQAYTLVVLAAPTVSVSPSSLPPALEGQSYAQTFNASGGTAPYAFSVTSGSLPNGLTLAANGELSGISAEAGSFNFTVQAVDINGYAGTVSLTLEVQAAPTLSISPSTLPAAQAGLPYSQALTASGGTAPYTFSATGLPAGLTLTAEGTLAGTPTASGSSFFNVTVVDGNGYSLTQSFSFTVDPEPVITLQPATLITGRVNQAYSVAFSASGGTAPYTFSLTGGLPAGMTLSSGGTLFGTPSEAGTWTLSVSAEDTQGFVGSANYSLTIDPAPTLVVGPSQLATGRVGQSYLQTLTTSGGLAPYAYTLVSGNLPAGLTLSSTGVLSGTPSTDGTFTFTVEAIDGNGDAGSTELTLTIGPAPTIVVTSSVPGMTAGAPVTGGLSASGGTEPYTFVVSNGSLPAGVTLSSNGSFAGTPTTAGTFSYSVTTTDGEGYQVTTNFSIQVSPALESRPGATPPPAEVGVPVAPFTPILIEGGADPYRYSISPNLPAGLTFNTATGEIQGTPTEPLPSTVFTITVVDGNGAVTTGTFTFVVSEPALQIQPLTMDLGREGTKVDRWFTASGGQAPYVFEAPEGLPSGLSLSREGHLTGTAWLSDTVRIADSLVFAIRVTDSAQRSLDAQATLLVAPRPDPSDDRAVQNLVTSQVDALRRFASAQTQNVTARLESLRDCQAERNMLQLQVGDQGSVGTEQLVARQSGCKEGAAAWVAGTILYSENDYQGTFSTPGITAGMDFRLSESVILGLAMGTGYESTDISRQEESSGNSVSLMGYGVWAATDVLRVEGLLGLSEASFDWTRLVALDNALADGSRDASQLFASLAIVADHRSGPLAIQPYLRAEYVSSHLAQGSETSSSDLALTYYGTRFESLTWVAGARAAWTIETDFGSIQPTARLEYRDEDSDATRQSLAYTDRPLTQYRFQVPNMGRTTGLAGLGLGFSLNKSLSGLIEVQRNFDHKGAEEDSIRGNLSWGFR